MHDHINTKLPHKIWVQTVCKGYQQTIKGGASKEKDFSSFDKNAIKDFGSLIYEQKFQENSPSDI